MAPSTLAANGNVYSAAKAAVLSLTQFLAQRGRTGHEDMGHIGGSAHVVRDREVADLALNETVVIFR